MKKKLISAIVAMVCTLTVGIGATLAYLASISGPVINVFTVGDVSINLSETTGADYQLIPGTTVEKDPVVTVEKGSEECYVYVKLEWRGGLENYALYELADGWINLGGIDGVYYRHVDATPINMNYHVLRDDRMVISSELTEEILATIAPDTCQLVVTAYAIQTLGMDSPAEGWYNLMNALEEG